MNNLKIGFIGYGRHGKMNLYPSLKILGYSITAVATRHEESAKQAALDYGISNYYTDYKVMFVKEQLDCVLISVKVEEQFQLVKDALSAGLHVFVEKNLGFSGVEAQEIADLSEKVGKFVMVGFMKKFAPAYKKAFEITRDERFGDIISASFQFASRNFATNSKEYLLFAGIHFIDLIPYYLGEIKEVKGFETINEGSLSQTFSLITVNGATVSLYFCASPSWERGLHEIMISGKNGYVKVSAGDRVTYHFNGEKTTTPRWQTVTEDEIQLSTMLTTGGGGQQSLYLNGFVGELDHFLQAIKNNTKPINDAQSNVTTMRLFDQLIKCLE